MTLARTKRVNTRVGAFSFHHVAPEVFGGFEELSNGVKLATAEKALFDFAYLSAGKSRLFVVLPELELPRKFRRAELERWVSKIPSERSRTITRRKLREFLMNARWIAFGRELLVHDRMLSLVDRRRGSTINRHADHGAVANPRFEVRHVNSMKEWRCAVGFAIAARAAATSRSALAAVGVREA